MKFSLKLLDQHHSVQSGQNHNHHDAILLRAKVPITVFGVPFLSGVATTTTDPSDLSFSLRSNLPSGPSLKLSYSPPSTAVAAPLTVTLKSGVGLLGSPHNSPLVISAQFSVSPQNPNSTPIFSLQIKPQFGSFSLRKTTYSSPNPKLDSDAASMGFVPLERPIRKELSLEFPSKDTLLSGIAINARTMLPVTRQVGVNLRWGVNFPADVRKQLPFLTVNKIGIERVVEVVGVKEVEGKNCEGNVGDLDLLKSLCLSLRRDLEALQKENRVIKQSLEDMRHRALRGMGWAYQGHGDVVAKKALPLNENFGEFEQWKAKRSGREENERKESKKKASTAGDVESELQRAVKAAPLQ